MSSTFVGQLQKSLARLFKTADRKKKHQLKSAPTSSKHTKPMAAAMVGDYITLKTIPCAPNITVWGTINCTVQYCMTNYPLDVMYIVFHFFTTSLVLRGVKVDLQTVL
jgi:hypothetical protein